MHRAVIFQAALVTTAVASVYLVEGKQTRRSQDEDKRDEALHQHAGVAVVEVPAVRARGGQGKVLDDDAAEPPVGVIGVNVLAYMWVRWIGSEGQTYRSCVMRTIPPA